MSLLLLLLLATPLAPIDSTHVYYASKDTASLTSLLQQAETREDDLLCRYRLYPLTQESALIRDLPRGLDDGTARELALLAGLWGYRAGEASFPASIRHGLRSQGLLDEAVALDADDPLVLLVEGQSLMFKPRIAGGNAEEALARFQRLREVIRTSRQPAVAPLEADLWIWYALYKLKRDEAPTLRADLLAQNDLPLLYREFLNDPP
ncbi:MAG: hypothetical protein AAGI71_01980 [Bacteroidota bacterium]